ncbi:hypothetical protein BGZ80_007933 [Entomortierella chlamydospora]|uniref:Uncharacterized protein n=1 Tax=Entomortierella chlamydospora TaxID=101097 RepID=A0A9P6SRH3_9FUNG|nr:hypothetical protein BGZ80_007933 [Entomortierella chlamydospora]KAF9995081.1 hypothetical protein BGZ79_000126 [Entomortierella chlamydospora]
MNSEIESKAGRSSATKVGGMRVPAKDHSVPVVRKEHRRPSGDKDAEAENEDERQLEKLEQLEYERQAQAAAERLARIQESIPKNDLNNSFKQKQNIQVNQPILHNHSKSGIAALN